jgi:hypothetical protein
VLSTVRGTAATRRATIVERSSISRRRRGRSFSKLRRKWATARCV